MKALTFNGIGSIRYEEIPDPVLINDGDVIVHTEHCAICGSDLHVLHGREQGIDLHTAMGHEFTGEVVEVGKKVGRFRPGDKVVSPFTTACGKCYYCLHGLSARCIHNQIYGWVQNGTGLQGGQAEYVRVPLADSTLINYEEYDLSGELALLAGDVFSTGYFGASMAEVKKGGSVVVIGCGPVGLMAVYSALLMDAGKILAVDTIDRRLQFANKMGAIALDASQPVREAVFQYTEGRGADAVIEAVGSAPAQRLAFELVRPGGIIATIGVHTTDHFVFKPADVYNKNITYKSGRCPARSLMETTLPLLAANVQTLSNIITHRMNLKEGVNAYEIFDQKKDGCIKLILSTD